MSDPINSISSSVIPLIQQWSTPYPATEYPISFTGIPHSLQWNNPFPTVENPTSSIQTLNRNHDGHLYTTTPATPPQNHTPILPKSLATKSHPDFTKITLRLYQNHTPTLPKSYSDYTKITVRLYQNHSPTLPNHTPTSPKSQSDFTKITLRLYQNHSPTLPKSYSDFTKIIPWLCLKPPIPSYNYIFRIKWKHQPNTYLSPSFSML